VTATSLDRARDQAAHTSKVTRQIADGAHRLALIHDPADPDIAARATALDSLADTAHLVAQSIDRCLTSPNHQPDPEPAAATLERLELAHRWITLLGSVLTAATAIYASLCARLADHGAVTEEHRSSSPDSSQLTAATLARTAHALRRKAP
jgi:hypothetical protein